MSGKKNPEKMMSISIQGLKQELKTLAIVLKTEFFDDNVLLRTESSCTVNSNVKHI